MSSRPYVHLHCHSHYSLLDGASRVPELVQQCKSQGMNALALTDHGNLYGAIEFYQACRDPKIDINPVLGYEAYIAPRKRTDRDAGRRREAGFHLTLLAQNATGFKNLIKMASVAFTEGYYYVPRIDKELLAAHKEGIVCLSGCASSEFSRHILSDQLDEATKTAEWFAQLFGDKHFFIEIQNNGLEIQRQQMAGAVEVANRLGMPLVATCDAHYLCQDDAFAHEVLLCINTGAKLTDEKRMSYGSDQFFVQAPEEMYRRFPDHADAVRRSQEIADSVDIRLDFKKRHFPVFTPPEGLTAEQYLRQIAYTGAAGRYGDPLSQPVRDRLEHELGIICRMGFASYFLITWDFVRFAVEAGIPCTARGSGCGSIVCYVLQLSHVDPLEYDLLFERFLDPNRAEAPDIDIDFCQDRRELVIAYVKQKYGAESVAQIATFGTLAARAAIKDVGRVMDIPLERVNMLANLVPTKPVGISLDDALKQVQDLRKLYDNDPEVHKWLNIALKLEGTNRNAGTHAAGVVIANGPITDYVPVHRVIRKGGDAGDGEPVITTQWVMGDLEKVGMLKMDFLGLRTLTVLDGALRLIKKCRGEDIDLYKLPIDDAPTYQLLQRGDAKGVFQFESQGIRDLLRRMKPDNIRDIIACTALYRPGPLEGGLVDEYIDCKHGRKTPVYAHPIIEEALNQTFGVMVFQEDIMRMLNRLGGIELSSAYACIKAISKKKQEIIDARQVDFVKGAQHQGVSAKEAKDIFEMIVKFAGYGFNKSHSAAYAYVSYHTAYLKTHYTPEFMAALLSSEVDDGNKRDILVEHIADARRLGVEVLPPDVNSGDADFTVVDGKIVFGLTAIKGLGRQAAQEVVRVRTEGGPYRDIYDFCERVDSKLVGRAAVERMIKAGAFDRLGKRSAQMMVLPKAMDSAASLQKDRRRGQMNLLDVLDGDGSDGTPARHNEPLPTIPEWSETERLKYEKESLDFYFSSHPLAQYDADLRRFSTHTVEQAMNLDNAADVKIGGMLSQVRTFTSKRSGDPYVRCKLEDFTGLAECVMWPSDYTRFKSEFGDDKIVLAQARIERKPGEDPIFVLYKILSVEQARREMTKSVVLRLNLANHSPEVVDGLARTLRRTPGPCGVYLAVTDGSGRQAQFRLGEDFRVDPQKLAIDELERLLEPGGGAVQFSGRG